MLRREYVLVGDTRAIEFTRTVDGMSESCTLRVARLVADVDNAEIHAARRRPLRTRNSTAVERGQADFFNNTGQLEAIPTNDNNTAFPPPPNMFPPPLSSSPSKGGALARALNLASKKLFGAAGYSRSPTVYHDRSA